jgi:hypothetical protein
LVFEERHMTQPESRNEWNRDVSRVAGELAERLRARGIAVNDDDSPDDVVAMAEAVEEFESAVESRGGDLMVDEPPVRGAPQPDDPHFLLPKRAADESVSDYLERLKRRTAAVRQHQRRP